MIQLKRILLPTDFSPYSGCATPYALELAEKFDAEVHVLHILEMHSAPPRFVMGLAVPAKAEESETEALEKMNAFLGAVAGKGRPMVRATAHGTPFVEIIRYAKEHAIDLIVMGTHGHSALQHVLMGSVAERVVRKAPCPVLTVRPEGHQFVLP